MASTISAYPAGISTGSRFPNHWSVVVETPDTASSTPKEPRPQCVSEDTLAPSRPTTPAPLSEPTAPQRAARPPMPRYSPTRAEKEKKKSRLDHVSSKLHTATPNTGCRRPYSRIGSRPMRTAASVTDGVSLTMRRAFSHAG